MEAVEALFIFDIAGLERNRIRAKRNVFHLLRNRPASVCQTEIYWRTVGKRQLTCDEMVVIAVLL
jgi:hypothetical protein